jgi:hypothetical protein
MGVNPMEVALVELRKTARILLGSLYSHAFVRFSDPTQVSLAPVFYRRKLGWTEKVTVVSGT